MGTTIKIQHKAWLAIAVLLIVSLACTTITQGVNINSDRIQGSGTLVRETRQIGEISRVDLQSFGNLEVQFGDQYALEVEAEDNLMQYIETNTSDVTLVIGTRSNTNLNPTRTTKYFLTVPYLENVTIKGSSDVAIPNMETDYLTLDILGSGDVKIASLDAVELEISIKGSGDIAVDRGKLQRLIIGVLGSGDVDVSDLEAQEVDISIPGSGKVKVWATASLNVSIPGSGDVEYYGDPADVSLSSPGSGSIKKLGDK